MTAKECDYELVFDRSECGSSHYTYYGLLTDYQSPADILVRWPKKGFGHHVEGAADLAAAKAEEFVKRWNCHGDMLAAIKALMPYAQASIGLPREIWPYDSVIFQAERAIEKAEKGNAPERMREEEEAEEERRNNGQFGVGA